MAMLEEEVEVDGYIKSQTGVRQSVGNGEEPSWETK